MQRNSGARTSDDDAVMAVRENDRTSSSELLLLLLSRSVRMLEPGVSLCLARCPYQLRRRRSAGPRLDGRWLPALLN